MNKSIYINTSTLPSDVFDFKHDDFYDFINFQCGPIQANILKFQLISDAQIFIECDDPTQIMRYDSDKLEELKNKACLITKDGTSIVLPGVTASFSNLKKRLLKKFNEDMKQLKRNQNTFNTSTPLTTTTTSQKPIHELKDHIIKSVDQWINKYRDDLNLEANSSLTQVVDYKIECVDNSTGQQSAAIICGCGCKSTLSRHVNNGYFQLSNFYRHLERCSCSMMLSKLKNQVNSSSSNQQPSPSSQNPQSSNNLSSSIVAVNDSNNSQSRKRSIPVNRNIGGRANKRRR